MIRFRETDAIVANPGRGFMANARAPRAATRYPVSTAYMRFNWEELEPAEGKPDWRPLDAAIAAWRKRGARVAFRIMTANAHSRGYYTSPKWLFDLGCRSFEYLRGGDDPTSGGARIPRIEPDYSDPLYLEKHARFLRRLGERYDRSGAVEFLDIGSYGIWGEWHTSHPAGIEVRRRIIDMYFEAFPRTPLVFMSDDAEGLDYALSKGAGFRRDGVGSPGHERNWIGSKKYAGVRGFADAWLRAPAVFEWYGNYEYHLRRQWSFERGVRFMLDNHVTLINDNAGQVPEQARPLMDELARRAGYRFVLREVSHPAEAARGSALPVRMEWSNTGVGKLYREYPLELYLLDSTGKVAHRQRARADARNWLPGDHAIEEPVALPRGLRPGTYTLGLALVDSAGKPAIRLACDAPESGLLYRAGKVALR